MLNKSLILIILTVFASGCGMEARTYVETKDRVDLDQTGNGGCVMGKCPPPPAPVERTRNIYVLEITKPVPESEVKKIEQNAISAIADSTQTPPAAASVPETSQAAVSPVTPNEGNMQAQTYIVQKDDTLQKISKKVYGTYARWYKIYKANKDKIRNPNFVKPGTVLTIPVINK